MKTRNAITLLVLFVSFFASAKELSTKEIQKILLKFDVIETIDSITSNNPSDFWRAIQASNKPYQEALKAAKDGKAKEAQGAIGESVALMRQYNQMIPTIDNIDFLTDSLLSNAGVGSIYREAKLYVTTEPDENAYTYPGGDVYLTYGIVQRLNGNYNMLMGVYAHELSHFVLQHAFSSLYFSKKKAKKNKLIGEVLAAIQVGAAAYGDIQFASNGVETHLTDIAIDNSIVINNELAKDHIKYVFKYNRDQEYEADIIAYRFLEWLGIGGQAYIDMLRLLDSELEIFQNNETDHPLTSNRIAVLEFMANPNYANDRERSKQELRRAEQMRKYDDIY